jgi:hypothetical protein
MTDAAKRLAELDRADFTPPWEYDEPDPMTTLQPGEFEAIKEAFYDHIWEDRARQGDGFAILFGVMGSIASPGGTREWARAEATQALRRVMRRVLIGEDQAEVDNHG